MKTGDLIMAHGEPALVLEASVDSAKILMQNGWQKWVSLGINDLPLEKGTFVYEVKEK
jgi:hypothetical protein